MSSHDSVIESSDGPNYCIAVSRSTLHEQLTKDGLTNDQAVKSTSYLHQMSSYIQEHPGVLTALKGGLDAHDVYKGSKAAVGAAAYTGSLNTMIRNHGMSGGATVLGVFVDRFGALARSQGIELNECALSVAKLATDIGGAGVGAVTSVGGFGVLLLGISVVSTFQDSYSLVNACSLNQE